MLSSPARLSPNENKGNKMTLSKIFLTTLLLLTMNSVHASVQIMATRIIFDEKDKEETIRVNNMGTTPSLTQVWLESDSNHNIDNTVKQDLPFVINPPVSRINVGKGKTFRVFATDVARNTYAQDRETLLWLNILDIPPVDDNHNPGELEYKEEMKNDNENKDRNLLSFAFKTKLKFFYRPDGLKSDPISAADQVVWSANKVGNKIHIKGNNKNAYHVSMAKLTLATGSEDQELPGDMIKPFSSNDFVFDAFGQAKKFKLTYTYITDLGAFVPKEVDIEI